MSDESSFAPETSAVAGLNKAELTTVHPKYGTYPSISSIPHTSAERIAQAAEDRPEASDVSSSDTVLYLAYGSNLSAETFLGSRKIRPLSQVNVSVPILRLTFSLPGLAYREPCFANVDFRKLPEKPKLPDPINPMPLPPFDPSDPGSVWDGGLIGVVYEVTQEDYRNIMRTEGAGSSYKEIVVPCIPIPPKVSIPEKPPLPELPKPLLARTLFAPYIAPNKDDPRQKKWWYKLATGPHRPNPDYAQPSERYLKLLTDGAREHHLPDQYQEYMQSLRPYTRTTTMQKIGQWAFIISFAPVILIFLSLTNLFADETGKIPKGLAIIVTVLFNLPWVAYDWIFKPIFGDGERTIGDEKDSQVSDGEMAPLLAKRRKSEV